jgi:hypothetical protein
VLKISSISKESLMDFSNSQILKVTAEGAKKRYTCLPKRRVRRRKGRLKDLVIDKDLVENC